MSGQEEEEEEKSESMFLPLPLLLGRYSLLCTIIGMRMCLDVYQSALNKASKTF